MRKLVAILFLGLGLAAYGVALNAAPAYADETSRTTKPLIKCDTCGTLFTSQAGIEDHLKAYPEHKVGAPVEPQATKPIITCETCGTTFTSRAGLEEHLKTHPGHKAAPASAKPLIRCSTCGVEFTSPAGVEEHIKAHPEHKMAPEQ